jgi:hypothetical protein
VSGRRVLGVLEVPEHRGGRFFSKSPRLARTAGRELSSLCTELKRLHLSFPAPGGGQTMLTNLGGTLS